MSMSTFLVALMLFPLGQAGSGVLVGNPEAGRTLWEGPDLECRDCHGGPKAVGAFGPDLAGRRLTLAQFSHAIRKPWGIMPAFPDPSQISDQEIANLLAYFETLPDVAEPGPWRREVPAGAPRGLEVATTTGCVQCHNPRFNGGRAQMGAVDADFEWLKAIVYTHTTAIRQHRTVLEEPPARIHMGNFSRLHLPESQLLEIWTYMRDLGFRAPVEGALSAGVASASGVTYTLNVENFGVRGKGLTAEGVTVTLILPTGANVISTTGAGYQGVRRDEQAKANVAEWRVPRMAPKDEQTYTITLTRAGTAENNLRGRISWTKPVKTEPIDSENIPPAPLVAPTQ